MLTAMALVTKINRGNATKRCVSHRVNKGDSSRDDATGSDVFSLLSCVGKTTYQVSFSL